MRKNEYNGASTEDDASGRLADDIMKSLRGAGTDDAHIAMLAERPSRRATSCAWI